MKRTVFILIGTVALSFWLQSCGPETPPVPPTEGPTPYTLELPERFQKPNLLAENPLTVEGIALGRKLFYEKMLSDNGTQACADCHHQSAGFTDLQKQFSTGSNGDIGKRNAMPLFNLNWARGYFWDGRQPTLESLIEEPMEAHNEMNLDIETAVLRLKDDPYYPELFQTAFPSQGITTTTLRFAIAQFLRTIISGGNTKWDQYLKADLQNPDTFMTAQEARGFAAFISETKGDCAHCHSNLSPFLSAGLDRDFSNNGLDAQPDSGRYRVSGNPNDLGKFKTPSLRNLSYTGPYMHDGRFATLDEVLEHYNSGFKYSPSIDPVLIKHADKDNNYVPIPRLTQQDKDDIIAFLKLLDDETLLTNPKWSKP